MATNVVLQTKESRDLLTTNYSSAVATGTAFRVSASPTDNYSFELVPSGTDASAVIKIEGSINSSTGPFTQIGVSMTPIRGRHTTEVASWPYQHRWNHAKLNWIDPSRLVLTRVRLLRRSRG